MNRIANKNLIAYSFAVLATLVALSDSWTDPDTGYTWTYSINGETAEILYNPHSDAISPTPTGALTIPSLLGGKPVASIGHEVFYCSGLTSVTIPASVISIASSAFAGCSGRESFSVAADNPSYKSESGLLLTKDGKMLVAGVNGNVTIPDSVTGIGDHAFYGCSGLTSVTIPDSVTSIASYAFYGCSGLTSVTIPSAVTNIDAYAFYECNGLTAVYTPSLDAWCGISFYGKYDNPIFYAHNLYVDGELLQHVEIPYGVTSIAVRAFAGCSSIQSLYIPCSVTKIGTDAFDDCSLLREISLPITLRGNLEEMLLHGCSSDLMLNYYGEYHTVCFDPSGGLPIPNTTDVVEWNTIGELPTVSKEGFLFVGWFDGDGRKYESDSLIDSDIQLVARWEKLVYQVVFHGEIVEKRSIEYGEPIGEFPTFYEDGYRFLGWRCSDVEGELTPDYIVKSDLNIFPDLDFIGYTISFDMNGADSESEIPSILPTDNLWASDFPVPRSEKMTFLGWYDEPVGGRRVVGLWRSEHSMTLYAHWAHNATLDNVEWLYVLDGNEAEIHSCNTDQPSISVPSELDGFVVTRIGENAFRGNSSLQSLMIPGSVTNIGAYAFYGCTNLESIVLSEGLVSLSSGAFAMCTKLTSVELPSTLIELGPKEARVSEAARDDIFHYGEFESYIGVHNGVSALLEVDWGAVASRFGAAVATNTVDSTTSEIIAWSHREDFVEYDDAVSGGGFSITNSSAIVKSEGFIPQADGTYEFRTRTVTNNMVVGRFYYNDCGRGPFEGCRSLEQVNLNYGLERIGAGAFKDCTALKSLTIPNTVVAVGGHNELVLNDVSVVRTKHPVYLYNADGTISMDQKFVYLETKPEDKNGVKMQGCGFLQGCTNLVDVALPDSLQYLGPFSFAGCTSLESIELPDSLVTLQQGTFSGCERLSHVKFPSSLDLIGGYEWYLQEKSTTDEITIYVPYADGTVGAERRSIYELRNSDGTIVRSAGVKGLLDYNYTVYVPRPDGTYSVETRIPDAPFYNEDGILTTLSQIDFEDYASAVLLSAAYFDNRWEDGVFDVEFPPANDCPILSHGGDYLGELTCLVKAQYSPEYRQRLEKRNRFCPSAPVYRKQLKFNEFVPQDGVFYACDSLGEIALPDTVRRIGDYAFYDCSNLSLAAVPESLEVVGCKAFGGKTSLPNIGAPWQGYDDTLDALLASGKSYVEIGDIVRGLIELVEAKGDEISEDDRLAIFKTALNTYQYAVYSYGLKGYASFNGIIDLLGSLSDLIFGLGVNLSDAVKQRIIENAFDVAVGSLVNSTSIDRDLSGLESFAGVGELLSGLANFVDSLGTELTTSAKQQILDGAFIATTNALFCLTSPERDFSGIESFTGVGELLSDLANVLNSLGAELTTSAKQHMLDGAFVATTNALFCLTSLERDLSGLDSLSGIDELLFGFADIVTCIAQVDVPISLRQDIIETIITDVCCSVRGIVARYMSDDSTDGGNFGLENVLCGLYGVLESLSETSLSTIKKARFSKMIVDLSSYAVEHGCQEPNLIATVDACLDSLEAMPVDLIPELDDDATNEDVAAVLADLPDKALSIAIASPAEYVEFRKWANYVVEGASAVAANEHAAAAYLLGAGTLFNNAPVIDISAVEIGDCSGDPEENGAITLGVTVKDGENTVAVASEKVKMMFEATRSLDDWTGEAKLTPTVEVLESSGATMRFKVRPGDGTAPSAFLRIRSK